MKKMLVLATLLMAMIIMPTTVHARFNHYKQIEKVSDAPRLEIGMLYSRDSAGQYIFAAPYGMIVIHYGKTFDFTAKGLLPCTKYTLVSSNGLLIKQMKTDRNGEISHSGAWKYDEDYNVKRDETEHFRRDDLEVVRTLKPKFIPGSIFACVPKLLA